MLGSSTVAAAAAQLLGQASRLLPGAGSGSHSMQSVARALATAAQRLAFVDACSTRLVQASGKEVSRENAASQVCCC